MNLQCKKCGRIFPSGLSFRNSSNVTFSGNTSSCPHCGTVNAIPDGNFSFDEVGNATLIAKIENLKLDITQLTRLENIARRASEENMSVHQFKDEISLINPSVASIIPGNISTSAAFFSFIAAILFVLAMLKNKDTLPKSTNINFQRNTNTEKAPIIVKEKREKKKVKDSAAIEWHEAQKRHREFLNKQKRNKN